MSLKESCSPLSSVNIKGLIVSTSFFTQQLHYQELISTKQSHKRMTITRYSPSRQ